MKLPTLETHRLTLRPLVVSDAEAMYAIYSDAETMRYMPTNPHGSLAVTQETIRYEIKPNARKWAICLKGTDTPIGSIGYLANTRIPGMGYLLARPLLA